MSATTKHFLKYDLLAQIYSVSTCSKRVVLLLDQSFYPVKSISWRKAMDLVVWREKAEPLAFYEDREHLFNMSVIRLLYRRVPYQVRKRPERFDRRHMYVRDGYKCRYCGKTGVKLTIDHVLPRSRGGQTSFSNCVAACRPCNNRKDNRTPEEAQMLLRSPPVSIFEGVRIDKNTAPEEWRPFLR